MRFHYFIAGRWQHWLVIGLLLAMLAPRALHAQGEDGPAWQPGPVSISSFNLLCLDPTRPTSLVVVEGETTVAYDWASGARTLLSQRAYDRCSPAGLLFDVTDREGNAIEGPIWRYNLADGSERRIAHVPTDFATDGTLQLYSLHEDGRLWASADGGLSWQRRGAGLAGKLTRLAVSAADGQAIYAIGLEREPGRDRQIAARATIYFSPDAGQSWEPRASIPFSGWSGNIEWYIGIAPLRGSSAPVDALELYHWNGSITPSGSAITLLLSLDGGRSFRELGEIRGFGNAINLVHTGNGILKLVAGRYGGGAELTRLADDGVTWLPVALPPLGESHFSCSGRNLISASFAPANLLLCVRGAYWHSADGGATWQPLGVNTEWPSFTSSLPLALLDLRSSGPIYRLALPDAGPRLTEPRPPSGAPRGAFFPETGHELAGCFAEAWQKYGGLARVGLPLSAPFRELNAADGRVYLVQYFERARLEYAPTHAGACAAIRLGLIGNELIAARQAGGEAPFQPVANPGLTEVRYFAVTGHTLRGMFRAFWETQGGLAQLGYPRSEEFYERHAENGQLYLVQYFERARLELHPEGAGYVVRLGRIGNELLQARGWR